MTFSKLTSSALLALALAYSAQASADSIVNIDASQYGYNSTAGSVIGNTYSLTGYDNAGTYSLLQLTLAAGDYSWSNASGLTGASYNDYAFRLGGTSWAWDFAAFDDETKTLLFKGGIAQQTSQAAAQTLSAGLSGTFSLAKTTTIDFAVMDYRRADNVGGVSLSIAAVPEADTYAMMLAGLGLVGFMARRRQTA